MPPYTQANRLLSVNTPLGDDALLLTELSGEEGMSMPYHFTLGMLTEDAELDAARLLRQPVSVTMALPGGGTRVLHGLVSRFVRLGTAEGLTGVRADVVPWLWFLSLATDCRIFQNQGVPDIARQVFREAGYADFELRLTRAYPPREFCVQYRETHLNFVSRLLEEEGIFYFFEHTSERHLLVLADDASAVSPCPGFPSARMATAGGAWQDDDVVTRLEREHTVHPGKVTLADYDYLNPLLRLVNSVGGEAEEVFDYPGVYADPDAGDRYARLRLEEQAAMQEVVRGSGSCRAFQAGFRFDLEEHAHRDTNQAYQLLRVRHAATSGDYRGHGGGSGDAYHNEFLAIPHRIPFRPGRATPRPVVSGTQTALVVGPSGEEVWTDAHGRIKVQFYWDRQGQRDENSSCWVRVAQPWAGKGYGAVQIPRIGNEVVVEFLEGDPDRPLVTGCVYNADQAPPFAQPGIQMGMKSRTSPGGGGSNEITLNDTDGSELINIHAQHDMVTTVENDQTTTVNAGNRTVTVSAGTLTETIHGDAGLTVQAGSRTVSVTGGDYSGTASAAVNLHGQGAGVSITGDAAGVTITGNGGPGVCVSGQPDVDLSGAARGLLHAPAVTVNGTTTCDILSPAVTVEGSATLQLTSPSIDVGSGTITLHGSSIVLSAGGGAIEVGAAGVTINGGTINISGGMVNVTGGMVKIN